MNWNKLKNALINRKRITFGKVQIVLISSRNNDLNLELSIQPSESISLRCFLKRSNGNMNEWQINESDLLIHSPSKKIANSLKGKGSLKDFKRDLEKIHGFFETLKTSFVFSRFDFPDLLDWSQENISNDILHTGKFESSFGRVSNLHITIHKNLQANVDEIKKIVANQGPIKVTLQGFDIIERRNLDVALIKVSSPDLLHIYKELAKLPCILYHSYMPHITLAYCRKNSIDNLKYRSFPLSGKILYLDQLTILNNGMRTKISLYKHNWLNNRHLGINFAGVAA